MKPLNQKLQKGVRAMLFALVATASIGTAIAMKPAAPNLSDKNVVTYTYGVRQYNANNWQVIADVTSPDTEYICDGPSMTCKVSHNGSAPLSPNALIPKSQAFNPQPGIFALQ